MNSSASDLTVVFVLPSVCKLELPAIPRLIIVDGQQKRGETCQIQRMMTKPVCAY